MKFSYIRFFILNALFLTHHYFYSIEYRPLSFTDQASVGDQYVDIYLLHELCDHFVMAADHLHYVPPSCRHKSLQLEHIKKGDLILVQGNMLESFFSTIHPNISVPYCVATYHNDVASPGKFVSYLDDPRIIAWFGINPTISNHPKFFAVPVGIPQDYIIPHQSHAQIQGHFNQLRSRPKHKMLYVNYCPYTNPMRDYITDLFKEEPFCTVGKFVPIFTFWQEIAQHKFTLSPPGKGIDCFRTWEAILLGSIPIVISSPLNELYKDLPILVINDWHEITEEFLCRKYEEITSQNYRVEKLYKQYWIQLLTNIKRNC